MKAAYEGDRIGVNAGTNTAPIKISASLINTQCQNAGKMKQEKKERAPAK